MTHDFIDGVLTVYNEEGGYARYPRNPETQKPFASEHAALQYVMSRPIYYATPPTLEEKQEQAKAELAAIRWEDETGGIELADGSKAATDRESQSSIANTYSSLKEGFIPSTRWKSVSGWITVTLEDLAPLAKAVAVHVSDCFTKEETVSLQIDACVTVEEIEAIDLRQAYNDVVVDDVVV